jgi:hydroxyethylthiazole kinase-like sugar kinase family protein
MLTDITATGCAVTAVMAAFVACAAPQQRAAAAAHALAVFGCVRVSVAYRVLLALLLCCSSHPSA